LRIDDRTGGNLQPLLGQVPLHLLKQSPAEIVRFEQLGGGEG